MKGGKGGGGGGGAHRVRDARLLGVQGRGLGLGKDVSLTERRQHRPLLWSRAAIQRVGEHVRRQHGAGLVSSE